MTKKSYADMDPLEEILAIKEEISRKFKTPSDYGEYLRKKYPNGVNPEKFVRPEDLDLEPLTPLFNEDEKNHTPPVYHPDMDPLEEIRAIKKEISREFWEKKHAADKKNSRPKRQKPAKRLLPA